MTTTSSAPFLAPPPQVAPRHLVGIDPAGGDDVVVVVFEIINGRARIISGPQS